MLTADVHTFPPDRPGGVGTEAPVWLAATGARLWLCAWDEVRERAWATAVGEPSQAVLSAGWQRDELSVGPWRCRLRRGSRKEVGALLERWAKRRPSGDPFPDQVPLPATPAPLATGVPDLPRPLAIPGRGLDTAASGLDEVWLAAIPTDALWPVHAFAGPTTTPLVLACSDHRNLLVALHPDGAPATVHPLPHGALPLNNKAWSVGDLSLRPRGPSALADLVDVLLAVTSPAERWALAVRHAFIEGAGRRALSLLAEAHQRGHAANAWPHLVQACQSLKQGPLAAASGWRALADDPDLDTTAVARLHQREASAMRKTMRQERLTWADVRKGIGGLFDDLAAVPDPPERLPWPPEGPLEIWGTALAMHGRFEPARDLWGRTRTGARRLVALAALAEAEGLPEASQAWRDAAVKARNEGQDAYPMIRQAVELGDAALYRWRWGAWAWRDGRADEAKAQWTRALELDDGGGIFAHALDVPGLLGLVEVALASGHPGVAERVLERVIDQEPRSWAHRSARASVLEGQGQHGRAAAVIRDAAVALDNEALDAPEVRRWELWVDAARLHQLAGRPERATQALREAVAGDFLDLECWVSALAAPVTVPPVLRGWWEHVFRVLAGEGALPGSPLQAPEAIDDASLDALHPGGAGWLQQLRQRLDTPEPPGFDALTRGLDRLREADFDPAAEVVESVSELLQLPVPPTGHVFRGVGAWGISAWPSRPPALLVGVQHLRAGERYLDDSALRFAIGAELVHLRCEHPVLSFDADWLGTSRNVYEQMSGWAGTAETVFDIVTLLPGLDQARKVQTLVKLARTAFKARGAVDKVVNLSDPVVDWLGLTGSDEARGLSREGLSGAALQFRIQAERAALVLTGDLRAAVDALFVMSTASAGLVDQVRSHGLAAVLSDTQSGLSGDELLRLSTLVAFAAGHMPWQGPPPDADRS